MEDEESPYNNREFLKMHTICQNKEKINHSLSMLMKACSPKEKTILKGTLGYI